MMAVDVSADRGFSLGKPRPLFAGGYLAGWDVTPDGQRFLMIQSDFRAPTQLMMIVKWSDDLKRRVPNRKR